MSPVLVIIWVVLVPIVTLVLDVVMAMHLFYIVTQAIKELLLRNTVAAEAAVYNLLAIHWGIQQHSVCRHLNSQ
jgi:hypothetical protein